MLEVQSIEAGGNEINKNTWLARWSPEVLEMPNSSKQDTVREWIKKVYVDKVYWDSSGAAVPDTAKETTPLQAAEKAATRSADTAPPAAAAKAPPNNMPYTPIQTNTAYFCENHNASEKRHKQDQPTSQPCSGCHVNFMTTYNPFTLCPSCSGSTMRCMICGASDEKQKAEVDEEQFDPSIAGNSAPRSAFAQAKASTGDMIDLLSGEEAKPNAAPSEDKWEANFSSEPFPNVPNSPAADLFCETTSPGTTPAPTSPDSDVFADTMPSAHTERKPRQSLVGAAAPASSSSELDMLDLEFPASVEPSEQSQTSQPAASKRSIVMIDSAGPPLPSGVEQVPLDKKEDNSAPIGERLREAVLNGSEKDIMKLYQEAKTPKVVEVVDPTRSAKFAALQDEELNALFNGGTCGEQESTSASDCGQSVSTSVEDQPRDPMQTAEGSATSGDASSPSVAHFFIGDEEEEDATKRKESSIPSFTPGLGESQTSSQMSAQQLSRLFAQQNPQQAQHDLKTQLSGKTPQQLQEMQAIINQMLQQQSTPASALQQQRSPAEQQAILSQMLQQQSTPRQRSPAEQQAIITQLLQQQSTAAAAAQQQRSPAEQAALVPGAPRLGGYPSASIPQSGINTSQATPQLNFGASDISQLNQLFADSKQMPKVAPSAPSHKPGASRGTTLDNAAKYCSPDYMKQEGGAPEPPKPFGDLLSAFDSKFAGLNR